MSHGLRNSLLLLVLAAATLRLIFPQVLRDLWPRVAAFGQRLSALAGRHRAGALILIWIVALVPMIHLSCLVCQYAVNVPTLDDWEMGPLIVNAHTGQLTFAQVFEQQQEARTVLPKLLFILLAGSRWDVRDLMWLSVISCWLTVAGIFVLLRRSGLNLAALALCFWLVIITVFSTAQFELWIFASGFPSFLLGLLLVTGLVVIGTNLPTFWKFVICAGLATASSFTLANGLLAWGLTFPALLASRSVPRWRSWLSAWVAVCALCATAYLWGYEKPSYHPDFAPHVSPLTYIQFIQEFLGGGLAYSLKKSPDLAATIFGAVQLVLFFAALIYCARRIRDRTLIAQTIPWFAVGCHSLGSAVLAALGRVAFGPSYALASRYVTFSIYLTIAVIALTAIIGRELARKYYPTRLRSSLLAACALLIVAYLVPFAACASNTRFFFRAWSAKDRLARAAVLFLPVIDTSEQIKKTTYPGDSRPVKERSEALDRLRLLRPPLVRTNHLGDLPHETAGGKPASGSCEKIDANGDLVRATGWAVLNGQGRPADCVAIAYQTSPDQDWILFALSNSFEMRPDMVKRFRTMEQLWSGWSATFPKGAVPPGARLSFWAVDADQPRLFQLADDSSGERR
ncbi:MAG TPA: hypothetical protein VJU77_05405 [Chthoniobacterales bacterium]|nr:hypothetical protein [Chthoniobacterales bacterium]